METEEQTETEGETDNHITYTNSSTNRPNTSYTTLDFTSSKLTTNKFCEQHKLTRKTHRALCLQGIGHAVIFSVSKKYLTHVL